MAEKVTTMKLKVDLQCEKCYKKVKKLLCKFPQKIRKQQFDEKENIVRIEVVCCSPEKIRDKLCCKGGGSIRSIEIVTGTGTGTGSTSTGTSTGTTSTGTGTGTGTGTTSTGTGTTSTGTGTGTTSTGTGTTSTGTGTTSTGTGTGTTSTGTGTGTSTTGTGTCLVPWLIPVLPPIAVPVGYPPPPPCHGCRPIRLCCNNGGLVLYNVGNYGMPVNYCCCGGGHCCESHCCELYFRDDDPFGCTIM